MAYRLVLGHYIGNNAVRAPFAFVRPLLVVVIAIGALLCGRGGANEPAMCINGFRTLPVGGVSVSPLSSQGYGLRVVDEGNYRSLMFRDALGKEALECQINLMQPEVPVQEDKRELLASFLLIPVQGHSMVLGMRNIGLIKFLRSFTPAQFIDVLESDPELISVAETYFSLRSDDRLSIRQDTRLDYLLSRPPGTYDVVYMDQGFVDEQGGLQKGLPSYARDRNFLMELRKRLSEQGVLVMALSSDPAKAERDIDSVIAAFPHVFAWDPPGGDGVLLAAFKHRQIVNPLIFRERARKLDQQVSIGFSFNSFIDRLLAGEYKVLEI